MTENLFKQSIVLKDRNLFEADNVNEVMVFDNTNVVLSVCGYELIIGGSDLVIVSLDSEKRTIVIKGCIDAVAYGEKTSKKGFLSRLFR